MGDLKIHFLTLVIICCLIWVIIIEFAYMNQFHPISDYRHYMGMFHRNKSDKNDSNDVIRILSWTKQYTFKPKWFLDGEGSFENCWNLPKTAKCTYTSDREFYNQSDAVILNSHQRPAVPEYRFAHQKWIFWAIEPPMNIERRMDMEAFHSYFNLTSTYSSDSDLQIPYVRKCDIQEDITPNMEKIRSIVKGKTKMVAWFVSRCETQSKREKYVEELQKYVSVDIYGKCGYKFCPRSNASQCYQMLKEDYKFYLSFENSLCKDYVTEKLYNVYPKLYVVPVVMGGANYSKLLPPETYLDALNFSSPYHLAEHLIALDKNTEQYSEMLRRQSMTRCDYVTAHNGRSYSCLLCQLLHGRRHKTDYIPDIRDFWSIEKACHPPPEEKFRDDDHSIPRKMIVQSDDFHLNGTNLKADDFIEID